MGEAKRRKQLNNGKNKSMSEDKQTQLSTHYERANIMYKLVYNCHMPEPYDKTDSDESCEMAVRYFAKILYSKPNTNPLKKKFKTLDEFLQWFNSTYELISLSS